MKYLLISFLIMICKICLAQPCPYFMQLVDSGDFYSKKAEYRKALNKFNAAKLCDPAKAIEIDKRIDIVFTAIENKKNEAIKQKNTATQALKLTQKVKAKITNIYTALSWAFQANDLSPNQGLQLLRKAYSLTGEDTSATKIIKGQIIKNFNSSITHQYREKSRLEIKDAGKNYVKDCFLLNDKWLEIVYKDQTIKNFELQKDKTFKPLANELKVVKFFARGDTIIRVFMYKPIKKDSAYKIIYEVTGKYPKKLKTEDSLKTVRYLNGDIIFTQSKDKKFKLWQTFGDLKPVNINIHENPDKFSINVKNKKLLVLVSNKLRIFDITTGLEKDTIGNENLNHFISNNFREMIDSNVNYYSFFSPNGKYLVIGFPKSIYLLQIFENLKLYKLQESNVWSINFSPDDKWVVIKDEQNKIKFFETSTGKEINFLRNEDKTGNVIFSKDSKWLISYGYSNHSYKLWSMDTYKEVTFLPTEDSSIQNIFFSSNGKSVSIITYSKGLRIFDLKSGKLLFHINDIIDDANYEFSSDSKWLIKTNFNSLDFYNVLNGQKIEFLKDETQILKAAFSTTTSNLFAAIDKKNILKLWSFDSLSIKNKFYDFDKSNFFKRIKIYNNNWMIVTDKQENKSIIKIDSLSFFTFLDNEKNIKKIEFSPDYKWLVSTTNNTEMTTDGNKKNYDEIAHENKIWEIATGSEPGFLKGLQIDYIGFSSDSNWLQIIEKGNFQRFYNLKTRSEAFFLKNLKIKKSKFSIDGKVLFTEDEVGNRKVWNMFSGEAYSMNNIGFPNEVYFSTDNKWLEAIYSDTITNKYSEYNILWYIKSDMQYFTDENKKIQAFLFSPCAKWLATQNLEDVTLWDVDTQKIIKKINKDDFIDMKFSSDEKLAFIQIKSTVYIIQKDVVINELKLTSIDSVSNVPSFSISSDNKWIVITDKSKSITIKEIPTLFDLFVKKTDQILAVKFSPDNKFLMANYLGGQYKLWNLSTKREVKLNEKENKIINYKFSADSSTLLLFFNNCLKIYDFSTGTIKQVVNENVSTEDILYFSHKWLINCSNHKLFVRNLENQKISDTLWTNVKVSDVVLLAEDILLIEVGNAIIKLDLKTQKGNIFSYGDGETMNYTFDEIQEWIRLFGDQYLEPLSDETKNKYSIKEDKINRLIKQ